MHLNKDPDSHCIKVTRVLDWVNKSTVLKLKEIINMGNKNQFDDFICCDFCIPYGERCILWSTYGINQIGGSICINFIRGNGKRLSVFVNGEKQADVFEGSSFSATFKHLESVEIQCSGESIRTGSCCGEFKIMLHFFPNDDWNIDSLKNIKKTKCYLSDCHGNIISFDRGCLMTCKEFTCKELTCTEKRENVRVRNELGETMLLQRIDILKQGYVCVQFINDKEEICFSHIFSFSEVETVDLCAPQGTKINCEIADVDCRAHIIPSVHNNSCCIEIVIILSICQNIKSVEEVIVELKGAICKPREDLNLMIY